MYELRIRNRHTYGHETFYSDNIPELKRKASSLIIDGEIELVEVKKINADWLKDITRYNPRKHKLSDIQSRLLYHNACVKKDFIDA